MYREYQPCGQLSPYIDKYWEFKGNTEPGIRINILPDGCTDFIFTLGEATQALKDNLVMQPFRSYFIGPMTTYSELVTHTTTVYMLGIRFRTCGIFRFMDLPLHELTDQRISTGNLSTFFDDSWVQQLYEKQNIREQINLIETTLLKALHSHEQIGDKQILLAVDRIVRHKGKLSIHSLIKDICLSQRHFERKFKIYTGYTPKEYSRIIQFRNAVGILQSTAFDNLLTIAIQAGFYDVPHLVREIKRMSGNTPRSFLSLSAESETAPLFIDS